MSKKHTLKIGEAICLIGAIYFICYMLSHDHVFPISINSVWHWISHGIPHFRALAVGLLPVYVALMIFGSAVLAVYLGAILQRWLIQWLRPKPSSSR